MLRIAPHHALFAPSRTTIYPLLPCLSRSKCSTCWPQRGEDSLAHFATLVVHTRIGCTAKLVALATSQSFLVGARRRRTPEPEPHAASPWAA